MTKTSKFFKLKKPKVNLTSSQSIQKCINRGRSVPNKRSKEYLIKLFNNEGMKTPEEEKEKKVRKKSMIVISERFCNTQGSKPLIPEDKLTNDF